MIQNKCFIFHMLYFFYIIICVLDFESNEKLIGFTMTCVFSMCVYVITFLSNYQC